MKRLTAYYFRAHMYTMVPRHVREDMQWMADVGTDHVAIGVLEQDLFAAVENIEVIYQEAVRAGMTLLAVPSRWAGLVAGCPKVPSIFTVRHPDAWVISPAGSDGREHWLGPICSVHHPKTFEFFSRSLARLFEIADFGGVIWDEPKNLKLVDHSLSARAALGPNAPASVHTAAATAFIGRLGRFVRELRPEARLALFTYAHQQAEVVDELAAIDPLDDFGCDGRPWGRTHAAALAAKDQREEDRDGKSLLDDAPRFINAARRHGKSPFMLIENHNFSSAMMPLLQQNLSHVLDLGAEHVAYYYYPRSVEAPDAVMTALAHHLKAARRPSRAS